MARAVREHGIICTLTGDGGDEAFGGYPEFWRAERLAQLASTPEWVLATAGGMARPLARWTRDAGRQVAKAVQLAQAGRSRAPRSWPACCNYLTEARSRSWSCLAPGWTASVYRHFGNRHSGASEIEALSGQLTTNYFDVSLPSDMLRKVDMMSMRAGIEVRVPMLDEELVALALSTAAPDQDRRTHGKLVLRDVAAKWLPPRGGQPSQARLHHPARRHGAW